MLQPYLTCSSVTSTTRSSVRLVAAMAIRSIRPFSEKSQEDVSARKKQVGFAAVVVVVLSIFFIQQARRAHTMRVHLGLSQQQFSHHSPAHALLCTSLPPRPNPCAQLVSEAAEKSDKSFRFHLAPKPLETWAEIHDPDAVSLSGMDVWRVRERTAQLWAGAQASLSS